jgi:hypothetical protein
VRDDEKATAGDDLLLDAGRALHQLADEAHQLGAEKDKKSFSFMAIYVKRKVIFFYQRSDRQYTDRCVCNVEATSREVAGDTAICRFV